jgi:GNAT superfamily N-acetyltransferase
MTSSGRGNTLFRRNILGRTFNRIYTVVRRLTGLHLYVVSERQVLADTRDWSAEGVLFCRLDFDQLRDATHDEELDLPADFVEGAIARGDECFGAYANGVLVSYLWLAGDWAPHVNGLIVKVRPPYVYIYKVFTRTTYRGIGIWPALSAAAARTSVGQSRERVMGIIEVDNISSRKTFGKLGAKRVGFAGFIVRRKRCLTFSGRAVKRTGFQFALAREHSRSQPIAASASLDASSLLDSP